VISILAPLGYAALLFHSGSYDASALLRFPFLFVVSLFYGYFMQLVRTQKVLREQAEQKNRGKAELLNVLSHELKTPLTVITSFTQALKGEVLGSVTADQSSLLHNRRNCPAMPFSMPGGTIEKRCQVSDWNNWTIVARISKNWL
jgi:signal transduction histidine kinase